MILTEQTPYLEFVIGFSCVISVIHFYLDIRQRKALKLPSPPKEVKDLYDADDFKKKQAYQLDKLTFSMIHSVYDTIQNIAFLILGYYPVTWQYSGIILSKLPYFSSGGEISQTIVWLLLLTIVSTILSLPWNIYRTFYLEACHGFNRTSPRTFIMDIAKSLLLTAILAPPIIAAIVHILIKIPGVKMALYLWSFMFGLAIIMMTIYPTVIAPLFNKYDPLPDSELRTKIEALAAQLNFPLKKLFVVDGSTRSAHSNAYMYGFFNNKRIVLYDTLINQCQPSEVVAVLAHELGHWKLGHTPVLFVASQVLLAAQLALFAVFRGAPGLYASFGFPPDQRPALAALLLFQLIIGPVDEVLGLLQNIVSRKFEFQADGFGVQLGKGKDLRSALCVLDKENKGAANVDKWYSTYHYSHPPLPERLRAIDNAMKKSS